MSGRLAIDSVLAVGAPAAGGIGNSLGDVARSVSRMGLPGVVCARDSPIPAAGAGAAAAVVSPRAGAGGTVGVVGTAEVAGAGETAEAGGAGGAAGTTGTGGAAEIAGAGGLAGAAGADSPTAVPGSGVAFADSTDPTVCMSAVAASVAGEGESSNTHTASAHRARLAAKRCVPRSRCMMSSNVGWLFVGPHDSPIRAGSGYRVGFAGVGNGRFVEQHLPGHRLHPHRRTEAQAQRQRQPHFTALRTIPGTAVRSRSHHVRSAAGGITARSG